MRRRLILLGCGVRAHAACGHAGPRSTERKSQPGRFRRAGWIAAGAGLLCRALLFRYDSDTVKDADGNIVRLAPDAPASGGLSATAPLLWYVSKAKVLGANYGVMAVLPWANASFEAPAFGFSDTVNTSFADILIRPIDLGWHTTRADVTAGFQFYAPTGRYELGGSDNIGKGMWTYEPFVGTTLYFDEARTTSLATTAFWEIHGNKKDSDVKVGQILTLEGGLGKSFLGGGLVIGAAYYAQWKLIEGFPDRVRAARRRSDYSGSSQQAQSVRPRAGRHVADRERVEAVRPGQHPLFLGNGRPGENTRADPRDYGDLPGSQRQAAMRERTVHGSGTT